LATRFDPLEERLDRLENTLDQWCHLFKEWSDDLAVRLLAKEQRADENNQARAATLQIILEQLDEISGRI